MNTETGEFLFERVPPGSARLTIEFRDCSSARAEFTVEEGAVVRPELRFLPPAQITGRVVARDDGRPMPMVTREHVRFIVTSRDTVFQA